MYQDLLKNAVNPRKIKIIEVGNDYDEDQVVFQSYAGNWIGRRGSFVEWPARSPDLTTLDFFMEAFKNLDLRQRIINEYQMIIPEVLENIRLHKTALSKALILV